MNYRLQNLLGAPYRGGNVVIVNNSLLISPVGNRVSVTDLLKSETTTLPLQASTNLRRIAASPDGVFLLTVDENNRCLFVNLPRRAVLHRITFKHPVADARFSPDGRFIAVAAGKLLQIWRSPGFKKEFFPFELNRTYADCNDRITSLDWSPNSDYLVVGSRDLTARLFYMNQSKKKNSYVKPFLFLGHRDVIVGVFFGVDKKTSAVKKVYTLSRDGAIFSWGYSGTDSKFEEMEEDLSGPDSPGTPEQSQGHNGENGTEIILKKSKGFNDDELEGEECGSILLHQMKWELLKKDFFMQSPAKLTSCDYHKGLDMVVVGFSNGVFALYQMPDFVCIHLLSISREKITTAVFNDLGNWLTFGCAKLGQLLVWEWKSESYILKQQGHYLDVNCLAFSPDSQLLATGADDNKIKVWTASSGFCFVTFSEHTNAVTALHFMANNHCLLSASLDGTVRAWDLFRYRNFRTFVTPTPKQFVSLAADQSGEVICAGTLDKFEIFVWSMKTGRLLDVLSGHEGPVHGLMFSPTNTVLASSSWDKTVRLWDIYEGKGGVEKFGHTHDVLALVYRPDGKQLACSTLDGQIHFWDPLEGLEMFTIEGRRDIAGGRLMTDRRSAANSTAGKCFTTLCYSADGSYILAGGSSKYICMYDIADQVLLRRFQITHNLSLDGVLDFLNSKKMTEAGPLDLHKLSKAHHNNKTDVDFFSEARESGLDIRYTTIGDDFPLEFDRYLNLAEYWSYWCREFPARVDEFVAKTVESDPCSVHFLVADIVNGWPAKIADKYKLVNAAFWTEPAFIFTLAYHWDVIREKGHAPRKDNMEAVEIDYVPGVESISTKDLMSYITDPDCVVAEGLFAAYMEAKKADFILLNTVHELEPEALSALNKYQPNYAVGPVNFYKNPSTVSKSFWPESDCADWLDSKPTGSVLYVSFGSLVQTSKRVIEEIAYGIILSEVNFIWIARPNNAVGSCDANVLPVGFENEVRDRGLIVPWCDQVKVLSNPAVGGFLTHNGWNSTVESMWCGVPMICYPIAYDQFTSRKLVVEDWKIGVNLCDGGDSFVGRKQVAEKIKTLMTSHVVRQEAQKVRDMLRDALQIGGSSERNFDQFVEDLKKKLSC